MVDTTQTQFFLGANTPEGFHSLYGQLLPSEEAHGIFILKGGAGCGKSTLMRQICAEAVARGYATEQILCSEDPNSLDGVVIPALKVAIADGTAPHVLEPCFAGLVERYVNMGDCYDSIGLKTVGNKLIPALKQYKNACLQTVPCLSTAGELAETITNVLATPKLAERLTKRATGIINREIKMKSPKTTGKVTQRFLSANTCQGRMALFHTAVKDCEKVFQLWDGYGIAHGLLMPILSAAVSRGYHVIACLNPMNPKRLEHLIIPELSLCFLSSSPLLPMEEGEYYRKIRLETMLDSGLLKQNRGRLRVYRKMYHSLLDEVVGILAENKTIHDEIEEIYKPFVDFEKVSQITKDLGVEIFGD